MSTQSILMPDYALQRFEGYEYPLKGGWIARPNTGWPYNRPNCESLFDLQPPVMSAIIRALPVTSIGDVFTQHAPSRPVIYSPRKGIAGITLLDENLVITSPPYIVRGDGTPPLKVVLPQNGFERDEVLEAMLTTTEPLMVLIVRRAGELVRRDEYYSFLQSRMQSVV